MCVGVAGRIVDRRADHPDLARVDVGGVVRDVNLSLLDAPVVAGDWVLVHLGFALERLTEREAQAHEAVRRFLVDGPTSAKPVVLEPTQVSS